jgi:DNA-binding response OmpR family regulator
VVEAESGAAALSRLDPAPDLLICDLGLPDMDGLALIAEVRARVPGLAVVVASGRTEAPDAEVVYLTKPYDGRDLRKAVEAALRERALVG